MEILTMNTTKRNNSGLDENDISKVFLNIKLMNRINNYDDLAMFNTTFVQQDNTWNAYNYGFWEGQEKFCPNYNVDELIMTDYPTHSLEEMALKTMIKDRKRVRIYDLNGYDHKKSYIYKQQSFWSYQIRNLHKYNHFNFDYACFDWKYNNLHNNDKIKVYLHQQPYNDFLIYKDINEQSNIVSRLFEYYETLSDCLGMGPFAAPIFDRLSDDTVKKLWKHIRLSELEKYILKYQIGYKPSKTEMKLLCQHLGRDVRYLFEFTRVPKVNTQRRLRMFRQVIKQNGSLSSIKSGMSIGTISDAMKSLVKDVIISKVEEVLGKCIEVANWLMWTQLITIVVSLICQVIEFIKRGSSIALVTSIVSGIVSLIISITSIVVINTVKLDGLIDVLVVQLTSIMDQFLPDNQSNERTVENTIESDMMVFSEPLSNKVDSPYTIELDPMIADLDLGGATEWPILSLLFGPIMCKQETTLRRSISDGNCLWDSVLTVFDQKPPEKGLFPDIKIDRVRRFKNLIYTQMIKKWPSLLDNWQHLEEASAAKDFYNEYHILKETTNHNIPVDTHLQGSTLSLAVISILYEVNFCIHTTTTESNKFDINHVGVGDLSDLTRRVYHLRLDNNHWEPLLMVDKVDKQSKVVDTILNTMIGVAGLSVSLAGLFGVEKATKFMRDFNLSSQFKKNLHENVTSIKNMSEELLETCFNVSISDKAKYIRQVNETIVELDNFEMVEPVFYQTEIQRFYDFKSAIQRATLLMTRTVTGQTDSRIIACNQLLGQCIAKAKVKYTRTCEALQSSSHRQETLLVNLVGPPGVGKTHFAINYLMPKVAEAMGWNGDYYSLSFGSQPEYFPIYNGAPMAIMDEFLSMKEEDPLVPHINVIGSQGHFNMPHAQLEHKVQPCAFKVLFTISNLPYIKLRNKFTPEYEKAFYSRFMTIHMDNETAGKARCREDIKHTQEYTELKFIKYLKPMGQDYMDYKMGTDKVEVCKEQIVDGIVTRIEKFASIYKEHQKKVKVSYDKPNIVKQAGSEIDNLVYLIRGEPGTGKSELGNKLGRSFAELFKMPLTIVTNQKLRNVLVTSPGIIVLHDHLADEKAYLAFYDSIPKPSLIINCSNIKLTKRRTLPDVRYALNISKSWFDVISNIGYDLALPKTFIASQYQYNCEPGFLRRIGVTGNILHMGQASYRSPELGGIIEATPGFLFYKDNECFSFSDIKKEIYGKMNNMLVSSGKLEYRTVSSIALHKIPSVSIECDSIEQLRDFVNDPIALIKGYKRSLSGDTTKPCLKLDPALANGTSTEFKFSPTMFHIHQYATIDEIKEMARSSFATLKTGGRDFTCYIEAGDDLKIFAHDDTIDVCTGKDLDEYYYHQIVKNNMELYKVCNDTKLLVGLWDLQALAVALENGFTGKQYTPEEVLYYQYFIDNKAKLERDPLYNRIKPRVQLQKISTSILKDETINFALLVDNFRKSLLYKVVIIALSIIVLITIITLTYNLFQKFFGSKEQGAIIYADFHGSIIRMHAKKREHDEKLRVSIEPSTDINVKEIPSEFIEGLLDLPVGDIEYLASEEQGDYIRDQHKNRKGKERMIKVKSFKPNIKHVAEQSGATMQREIIREKLSASVVRLVVAGKVTYGMGLCDNKILTPGHLWFNAEDELIKEGVVTRIEKGLPAVYNVRLLAYNDESDYAMCEVLDKTFNSFPNIVSYFIKDSDKNSVFQSTLLVRTDLARTRTNVFTGIVELMELYSGREDAAVERHFLFTKWGTGIPTKMGDCGLPYFGDAICLNERQCIGIHTGLSSSIRQAQASCITQEIIHNMLTKPQSKVSEDVIIDVDAPLPEMPVVLDGHYVDFIQELSPLYEIDKDDLWLTDNTPEKKLCALGWYKHNTPAESLKHEYIAGIWYEGKIKDEIDELDITTAPSIIHHTMADSSQVKLLNGKPSLLATQMDQYNDVLKWGEVQQELMQEAQKYLMPGYLELYGQNHRQLTTMEVINGLYIKNRGPYAEQLEPLDLDTSAGFYAKRYLKCVKKRQLFCESADKTSSGALLYKWDSHDKAMQMRYMVERCENLAQTGVRLFSVAQDNLKREVTKIGKSRMFESMDLPEIMLIRRYYGTFMAAVKVGHTDGHCQLGIDPLVEFNHIYNRFIKTSNVGEAGDFKRWDKHMQAPMIKLVMCCIRDIILNSLPEEEHAIFHQVNEVVTQMIIYTFTLADKVFYVKLTGNPSGNVLTTPLNSITNDFYHVGYILWAYRKVMKLRDDDKDFEDFFNVKVKEVGAQHWKVEGIQVPKLLKLTDWVTYGDDFCSVINPDIAWFCNFKLKQIYFMEMFNVLYDTPMKDGKIYKTLPIDQLQFLSRTFTLTASKIVTPRLKKSSIVSLLKWTRNNNPMIQFQAFKDCLDEAVLYDKEFYNKVLGVVRHIFTFYALQGNQLSFDFYPYAILRDRILDIIKYTRTPGVLACFIQKQAKATCRIGFQTRTNSLLEKQHCYLKEEDIMATGRDELNEILATASTPNVNTTELEQAIPGIAKGNIRQQLYKYDLRQQAHNRYWIRNVVIPVNTTTANQTIISIPYMHTDWMSPPMRAWAALHSLTDADIEYDFQFITAATIVNALVVGMREDYQAESTINELQLLQWAATPSNSDTRSITLKFASPLITMAGTTATAPLVGGVDPTVNPVIGDKVPTLVIQTLTEVQNSYQNDNVQVNIVVYGKFKERNDAWKYTIRDMTETLDSSSLTGTSGRLSDLLRLEANWPLYVTLDGSIVSPMETSDLISFWQADRVGNERRDNVLNYNCNWLGTNNIYASNSVLANFYSIDESNPVSDFTIPIVGNMSVRFNDTLFYSNPVRFNALMWAFLYWTYVDTTGIPTIITDLLKADNSSAGVAAIVNTLRNFTHSTYGSLKGGYANANFYCQMPNAPAWMHVDVMLINGPPLNLPRQPIVRSSGNLTTYLDIFSLILETWVSAGFQILSYASLGDDIVEPEFIQFDQHTMDIGGFTEPRPTFRSVDNSFESTANFQSLLVTISKDGSTSIYVIHFKYLQPIWDANSLVRSTPWTSTLLTGFTVPKFGSLANYSNGLAYQNVSGPYTSTSNITPKLVSNLALRLTDQRLSGVLTVPPGYSILEFANGLQPTISSTVVESLGRTVIREPNFSRSWRNYVRSLGIDVNSFYVRFRMSNTQNIVPTATVLYDGIYDVFMIGNNPVTADDSYRSYPKTIAEETLISQIQSVPRGNPVAGSTVTTRWPSRMTEDETLVFNGLKLSPYASLDKITISTTIKKRNQNHKQGQVLASMVGGGATGIANVLSQQAWFAQMDKTQQATLAAQLEQLTKTIDSNKALQAAAHQYKLEQMEYASKLAGGFTPFMQQQRNNAVVDSNPSMDEASFRSMMGLGQHNMTIEDFDKTNEGSYNRGRDEYTNDLDKPIRTNELTQPGPKQAELGEVIPTPIVSETKPSGAYSAVAPTASVSGNKSETTMTAPPQTSQEAIDQTSVPLNIDTSKNLFKPFVKSTETPQLPKSSDPSLAERKYYKQNDAERQDELKAFDNVRRLRKGQTVSDIPSGGLIFTRSSTTI